MQEITNSLQSTPVETAETKTESKGTLKSILGTGALLLALALTTNASAQEEILPETKKDIAKEIFTKSPMQIQGDTIAWDEETVGPNWEPDPEGGDDGEVIDEDGEISGSGLELDLQGGDNGEVIDGGEDKEKVGVHGVVRYGTGILPDFADIVSEKPTIVSCLDVSHLKTGFGITIIRVEDFSTGKITVLNPHRSKNFGKLHVDVEGKYSLLDKAPQANGFLPDVIGRYTTEKGWTFEGMYSHDFNTGTDGFRIGVEKEIFKTMKLVAQLFYKKECYGRFILEKDFGGVKGEISMVVRPGEVSRTVVGMWQL